MYRQLWAVLLTADEAEGITEGDTFEVTTKAGKVKTETAQVVLTFDDQVLVLTENALKVLG